MDIVCGDAQTEIGNIWMWTANITYYDWQEYHALQDLTKTIKHRIHSAGAGKHFDIMAEIQETAEAEVNDVAKEAANRLAELKKIGREKILMGDASENFEAGRISVDVNLEGVEKTTEAIYGTPQEPLESVLSEASKTIVPDTPIQSQVISPAQQFLSSAGEIAGEAASKISSAVLGTSQGIGESIVSQISTAILGTPQGVAESVASQVTSAVRDVYESAASYTSDVIDDIPAFSGIANKAKASTSSVGSLAGDAFDSASIVLSSTASVAQEGIINAKDRMQKPFKAPELSSSEKIASQLSEVVYSTEPGPVEKAKSAIESIGDQIADKASEVVYGREPSIVEKATDAAVSFADTAASEANEAIHNTEPGMVEKATDAAANTANLMASQASEIIYDNEPGIAEKLTEAGASTASKSTDAIYDTEPSVVDKAKDTAISGRERGASKASEVIYGKEPDIFEKTSIAASEASEVIEGKEPGTAEKAASVVGSIVAEAAPKVVEAVEDASSVSNVASEVTDAVGAATSNMRQNK